MVIFSSYVRRSLPFVSRFTSILILDINNINTVPSTNKGNNANVMDLNNRPQMPSAMTGMNFADVFPKGTIIQGGTFNFNFNMGSETGTGKENVVPRKKRKFVIDSDSD
jgi:hypothetical protein